MMTNSQQAAQAQNAPTPTKKLTQHQRIVRLLNNSPKHTIDQKLAGWTTWCRTTKLSTRIGEMERKVGVTLQRSIDKETRFVKYTATPEVLEQLNVYFFKNEEEA